MLLQKLGFRNVQRVLTNTLPSILHVPSGDHAFTSTSNADQPTSDHTTHTVVTQSGLLRLEPKAAHESTIVWLHGMGQTGTDWARSGECLGQGWCTRH